MYRIEDIIEGLTQKGDMRLEDIPEIDLYMDQVLTLFNKHFPYNEGEQALTKTMINNYAKSGVIKPAVKKKYTKEHILMIVITCLLKRGITMSEIRDLVTDSDVEEAYSLFVDQKKIMNDKLIEVMGPIMLDLKENKIMNSENKLFDVLMLCYYSNLLSEAARAIIRGEDD
ncbi:DUF1836 domain-containing protein [Peptostreptococcus sp. MV1]|mgnify:CR=1 FL=1|uniref:DUF1836 domain-containing protein n=1 Tax=Peptostreptococcus sp. MV1 TaxID=1219626 RepID=UPI00068E3FE3|nr:DUF1836 domain-containing protein [Peptostreptococcus sp. MV1]